MEQSEISESVWLFCERCGRISEFSSSDQARCDACTPEKKPSAAVPVSSDASSKNPLGDIAGCAGLLLIVVASYLFSRADPEAAQAVSWVIAGIGITVFIVLYLIATAPDRKAAHEVREEERRIRNLEQQRLAREAYELLRQQVRVMPEYAAWRTHVFEKRGKRCVSCGSYERIEVDHIRSFYSIVRAHGVRSVDDARGCSVLWDVENGRPLCKSCHDRTPTSMRRQAHKTIEVWGQEVQP